MMVFIPGILIALFTFPGVIMHEFGHKVLCDLMGVKVRKVVYFRLTLDKVPGYVIHDDVKNFRQAFFIVVGPLIVGTLSALLMFYVNILSPFLIEGILSEYVSIFSAWLGFCFGMHAFPSSGDAKALWAMSWGRLKHWNVFALIGFPVAMIIWLADKLRILWIDFFYAIGLYLVAMYSLEWFLIMLFG
jgi:hypothetical protein